MPTKIMCCHVRLVLMAHWYCVYGGWIGTSAADNVQKVNLIFMFMINSPRLLGAKECQENTI